MTVKAQLDCDLLCTVCGRESQTNFASSLREGWPKCCGYTMRLEHTDADIDQAVKQAVGSARHVRTEAGKPQP
jgi:hypothetical protein